MNDILVPTTNHHLVHNFLTTPDPKNFEGCRIWIVEDNRVIDRETRGTHSCWNRRPVSVNGNVQKVVTNAVELGLPVFPHVISGREIVRHYVEKWKTKAEHTHHMWQYPMTAKILAVSALHDFYGVQSILALDDDTVFFNPASRLFRHSNAMAAFRMNKRDAIPIKDKGKSSATFARLSEIAGYAHGAYEPSSAIKIYNALGFIGAAIKLVEIPEYTEHWRDVFQDSLIVEDKTSHVKKHLSQNLVGIMQIVRDGYIYDHRHDGEVFTSGVESATSSERDKRIYVDWENLTLYHYICGQMRKPLAAYWISRASKCETSTGRKFLENYKGCLDDFNSWIT